MTTALYRDTARRHAAQTIAEGAAEIPDDCYCRTPECRCPVRRVVLTEPSEENAPW
jgi:hypothetical protein